MNTQINKMDPHSFDDFFEQCLRSHEEFKILNFYHKSLFGCELTIEYIDHALDAYSFFKEGNFPEPIRTSLESTLNKMDAKYDSLCK